MYSPSGLSLHEGERHDGLFLCTPLLRKRLGAPLSSRLMLALCRSARALADGGGRASASYTMIRAPLRAPGKSCRGTYRGAPGATCAAPDGLSGKCKNPHGKHRFIEETASMRVQTQRLVRRFSLRDGTKQFTMPCRRLPDRGGRGALTTGQEHACNTHFLFRHAAPVIVQRHTAPHGACGRDTVICSRRLRILLSDCLRREPALRTNCSCSGVRKGRSVRSHCSRDTCIVRGG